MALDPKFGAAINWQAYCYIAKNDFGRALAYFKEYASVSPGDANPHDSMGELYFRIGKLDKAIGKFKEVVRTKPDFSAQFRLRLARLYEKEGKLRAAVKQYEKVLEVWKEADQGLTEVEEARQRLAALRTR